MTFPEFERYDAAGLAELIRTGAIGAREVVAAAIERIEAANPEINAVVTKTYNRALALVERGIPQGPFTGVPFLLKDLGSAWAGVPLTNGSRSMQWYVPDYTSTIVERFERAGVVILGKTNVPEFGLDGVTEPALHGITRNPWNPARTVGGSSGGAAAAVASGMVPMAHGTDGGGSIRIPASYCGLFGLKPTRARTPVGPVFGEAWFGFSVGHVLTRSVRDSAIMLDAVAGPEPGDPYEVRDPARPFSAEVGADPGRLRIGVVRGAIFGSSIHPENREAVSEASQLLHDLGHEVEQVELPIDVERFAWSFVVVAAAQASENLRLAGRLVGRELTREDVELEQWFLGIAGNALTAEDFVKAFNDMRTVGRTIGRVMEKVDVLVTATTARPPFPHGETKVEGIERRVLELIRPGTPRAMIVPILRRLAPVVLDAIPNTPLFNMTGQPAMSVPLHWTADGLPVGVQFAGRFGDEATLFRLAAQIEEARPWFHHHPALLTPTPA